MQKTFFEKLQVRIKSILQFSLLSAFLFYMTAGNVIKCTSQLWWIFRDLQVE